MNRKELRQQLSRHYATHVYKMAEICFWPVWGAATAAHMCYGLIPRVAVAPTGATLPWAIERVKRCRVDAENHKVAQTLG